MKLVINQLAVARSSRGVRRYFDRLAPPLLAGIRASGWQVDSFAPSASGLVDRLREWSYRTADAAVFWSPCQRGSLIADTQVVTVHDCINVEHVHARDWRVGAYKAIFSRVLARARRVVAISAATRDAILRNYDLDPRKLVVIRSASDLAVGQSEVAGTRPAAVRPAAVRTPFVLLVTNALPHKNTAFACRTFARSALPRAGVGLCIVGELAGEAREACRDGGITPTLCERIDDDALQALYRDCAFLWSPSLAEGHNLAIAEALCVGAPVLASDIPVHREFFDPYAQFFDPTDPDAAIADLDRLWQQHGPAAPRRPVSFGRGMHQVAAEYLALFGEVAREGGVRP